jgi:hypothetical protein
MLMGDIKYSDPRGVLQSIKDDAGINIPIYEQKDIGEFFSIFIDRL